VMRVSVAPFRLTIPTALSLDGEVGLLPSFDPGRHHEHVLVSKLDGAPGAFVAGRSSLVLAVEDERRVLVGG
jgi:hypothetical protein